MNDVTPIPLTVLGGWLGAGKTTLLNQLLRSTDERIAVIVNDVGEVNIDASLLAGAVADDSGVIELTNGCVCCSIGEDLELTLIELTLRTPTPERIVLEASGVADPRQIMGFATHRRIRPDAVVVLAEAAGFRERSDRPPYGSLQRSQVAGADLVIATKLDLVDDGERAATLDDLRSFTSAPVVAAQADADWLRAVVLGPHDTHAVRPATATAEVSTRVWHPTSIVDPDRIATVLADAGLLRAKGAITTPNGRTMIHLAGGRVALDVPDALPSEDAIVVIGNVPTTVDAALAALDAAASEEPADA